MTPDAALGVEAVFDRVDSCAPGFLEQAVFEIEVRGAVAIRVLDAGEPADVVEEVQGDLRAGAWVGRDRSLDLIGVVKAEAGGSVAGIGDGGLPCVSVIPVQGLADLGCGGAVAGHREELTALLNAMLESSGAVWIVVRTQSFTSVGMDYIFDVVIFKTLPVPASASTMTNSPFRRW